MVCRWWPTYTGNQPTSVLPGVDSPGEILKQIGGPMRRFRTHRCEQNRRANGNVRNGRDMNLTWLFPKIGVPGVPPNHPFVHRVFHYKQSILGYPYSWNHLHLNGIKVHWKIRRKQQGSLKMTPQNVRNRCEIATILLGNPSDFGMPILSQKSHVLVYFRSSNAGISLKMMDFPPADSFDCQNLKRLEFLSVLSFLCFFWCSAPLKKNSADCKQWGSILWTALERQKWFPWRTTLWRSFSATNSLLLLPCFLTPLVRETVLIRTFKRSLAALYCLHQPCYKCYKCHRWYEWNTWNTWSRYILNW